MPFLRQERNLQCLFRGYVSSVTDINVLHSVRGIFWKDLELKLFSTEMSSPRNSLYFWLGTQGRISNGGIWIKGLKGVSCQSSNCLTFYRQPLSPPQRSPTVVPWLHAWEKNARRLVPRAPVFFPQRSRYRFFLSLVFTNRSLCARESVNHQKTVILPSNVNGCG